MTGAHSRQEFIQALKNDLEENVFLHSLALEACMGGLFDYLSNGGELGVGEPPREVWLLAGLVHDADFSKDFDREEHPKKTREALAKHGLEISDEVDSIVKAHAPRRTGVEQKTKAQWAIYCADSLTGLITASALVLPSRKLADVKLSSVLKRFKDPKFAAGTRREEVAECAKPSGLSIPLEKFVEICLESMKGIAGEIGL
jgi:predicted hydrolase (HD superfamily)